MDISDVENEPSAPAGLRNSIGETATFNSGTGLTSKRPLTADDYRTLALAALGGALEFYDFIIFVFFAQALGQLFFPPEIPDWLRQVQTFGVFAVGYFVRPLGGIIIAHFGDLLGRKRMFTISIFMMAAATLGMGLLPVYAQVGAWAPFALVLLRIVQALPLAAKCLAPGSSCPSTCRQTASVLPAAR
jgi:MFS family permease